MKFQSSSLFEDVFDEEAYFFNQQQQWSANKDF